MSFNNRYFSYPLSGITKPFGQYPPTGLAKSEPFHLSNILKGNHQLIEKKQFGHDLWDHTGFLAE